MCIVSLVHDFGQKLPQDVWTLPGSIPAFEDIVKKAHEFDRVTKQPECFDPEKLKFLEVVKAEQPETDADAPPAEAAEPLQDEIETLKRVVRSQRESLLALVKERDEARAERDAAREKTEASQADLAGALKDVQDLAAEHDTLKIAYTRMALEGFRRVSVCGSGEFFTQIDIDLPTGPVRFFIDNVQASLLNGLPYGISDFKGAYDHDTQALRLTGAFHPDIDQVLIPEPPSVDRVLAAIEDIAPLDLSDIRFGVPHNNNKASSL